MFFDSIFDDDARAQTIVPGQINDEGAAAELSITNSNTDETPRRGIIESMISMSTSSSSSSSSSTINDGFSRQANTTLGPGEDGRAPPPVGGTSTAAPIDSTYRNVLLSRSSNRLRQSILSSDGANDPSTTSGESGSSIVGELHFHVNAMANAASRFLQLLHACLFDYKLHLAAQGEPLPGIEEVVRAWSRGRGKFSQVEAALGTVQTAPMFSTTEKSVGATGTANHDNDENTNVVDEDKGAARTSDTSSSSRVSGALDSNGHTKGNLTRNASVSVIVVVAVMSCASITLCIVSTSFTSDVIARYTSIASAVIQLIIVVVGACVGLARMGHQKGQCATIGAIAIPMRSSSTLPGELIGVTMGASPASVRVTGGYSPMPFLSNFVDINPFEVTDLTLNEVIMRHGVTLIVPLSNGNPPIIAPAEFLLHSARLIIIDAITRRILHWGEDLDDIFLYSTEERIGHKFSKSFAISATSEKNLVELRARENPRIVYEANVYPVSNWRGEESVLFFSVHHSNNVRASVSGPSGHAAVNLPMFSPDVPTGGTVGHSRPSFANTSIMSTSRYRAASSVSAHPGSSSLVHTHVCVFLADPITRQEALDSLWTWDVSVFACRTIEALQRLVNSGKIAKFDAVIVSADALAKDDIVALQRCGTSVYFQCESKNSLSISLGVKPEMQIVGSITSDMLRAILSSKRLEASLSYGAALSMQFRKIEHRVHIDNYTIIKRLGGGSFGECFKAELPATGGVVAIKRLYASEHNKAMVDQWISEINIMSKLSHEHIVQYLYSEREGESISIFMECCDSPSLTARLSSAEFQSSDRLAHFFDLVSAVSYLHSNGIVHADIKAENCLYRGNCLKLSDFGTAIMRRNAKNAVRGTFKTMAPEVVLSGETTPAADVWSIGCVLAEMLNIKLPHWSMTYPALMQLYRAMPLSSSLEISQMPQRATVPGDVLSLLQACLHRNPKERPTASSLLQSPMFVDGLFPNFIILPLESSGTDVLEHSLDSAMIQRSA